MTAARWIILVVVLAAGIGAGVYWYRSQQQEQAAPAAPQQAAEPQTHYPAPAPQKAEEVPEPPPQLDASDEAVRKALEQGFGKPTVERFLVPTEFIRHFVAFVDSLDRDPVSLRFWPVKHVESLPIVQTEDKRIFLSTENAGRYGPWVTALQSVDTHKLTDLYLHWYPLFQKAYEDLGYPGRYFNDRLVQVIDHLLATPEASGPIELVRPKVLYQFADPDLERRSWGQKTLIRMGAQNEAAVKAKLREIRAVVAANPQTAAPAP